MHNVLEAVYSSFKRLCLCNRTLARLVPLVLSSVVLVLVLVLFLVLRLKSCSSKYFFWLRRIPLSAMKAPKDLYIDSFSRSTTYSKVTFV